MGNVFNINKIIENNYAAVGWGEIGKLNTFDSSPIIELSERSYKILSCAQFYLLTGVKDPTKYLDELKESYDSVRRLWKEIKDKEEEISKDEIEPIKSSCSNVMNLSNKIIKEVQPLKVVQSYLKNNRYEDIVEIAYKIMGFGGYTGGILLHPPVTLFPMGSLRKKGIKHYKEFSEKWVDFLTYNFESINDKYFNDFTDYYKNIFLKNNFDQYDLKTPYTYDRAARAFLSYWLMLMRPDKYIHIRSNEWMEYLTGEKLSKEFKICNGANYQKLIEAAEKFKNNILAPLKPRDMLDVHTALYLYKDNVEEEEEEEEGEKVEETVEETEKDDENPIFMNSILYGPPGTGKTYKTAEKSIKIIKIGDGEERVKECKGKTSWETMKNIMEKYPGWVEFVTFHPSFSYEEFVEGLKPVNDKAGKIGYEVRSGVFKRICTEAAKQVFKDFPHCKAKKKNYSNYALIIDEINRGNIPQIFGELITLLEEDKRLGAEHEIRVSLPYSSSLPMSEKKKDDWKGMSFGVPPNLYVIGTMNTADRSIALVDLALRRRFVFEEMNPDPGLLEHEKVGSVDLQILLEKINERIELLKDRDHRIGHSYFLEVKNEKENKESKLRFVWYNKILPLLQEYFYGDPESIECVLNGKFIIIEKVEDDGKRKYFEKMPERDLGIKWEFKDSENILSDLEEVIKLKTKSSDQTTESKQTENT